DRRMPRDNAPGPDKELASSDTLVSGDAQTAADAPPVRLQSAPRLSLPDYELRDLLGRGGMGDVVLARDKAIGRDIAVKQLRADRASDDDIKRFLREARIQ